MMNLQLSPAVTRVAPLVLCSGFMLFSARAKAQQMEVKVIDRQESETKYTYQPGVHSTATSNIDNSATTAATVNPTNVSSFEVSGATLSLRLPDGRVAVVNCDSKFQEHLAGHPARRSCRTPPVDEIQADFKGSSAKLSWPVSIDGKKVESETYRIIGVIPKSAARARANATSSQSPQH
jgi:hypothetical protein